MAGTAASLSVRIAIRSGRGCTMLAAETRQALQDRGADGRDAQFQVERVGRRRERALVDHAAAFDERHAIAGRLHFAQQMRIEEHRDPVGAQLVDDAAHQQPAQRIEPGGRLVQEDELRIVQQRLRQPHALEHALAVAAQRAIGGVQQVDARQQPIDAGVQRDAAQPIEPPVEPQQLGRGERVVKAEMLGKKADARADRAIAERRAQHVPRAGRRRDQRQQHLDRRGLAGAVRPEKAEDLAGAHLQRQIGHREGVAELLAQGVGLDHPRTLPRLAISAPSLPWPAPVPSAPCSAGRTHDRASTRAPCGSAIRCGADAE